MIASNFPDMTVIGIDKCTDLSKLPHGCELAFIYSLDTKGNRYPSEKTITDLSKKLMGRPLAIHVRGQHARKKVLEGELNDMLYHFGRILIEGAVTSNELTQLLEKYHVKKIITEHSVENSGLRFIKSNNHELLVNAFEDDGLPVWNVPVTDKKIGFRGFTKSENMEKSLQFLVENAPGHWWIEAEDLFRTNDWFDAQRANQLFMNFLLATSPIRRGL